jgi:hypothetical protein
VEPGNSQESNSRSEPPGGVPVESSRDIQQERERRQRALSELAQHAGTPPATNDARSGVPRPLEAGDRQRATTSSRRRTRWFMVAGALLALALVASLLLPRFLTPPRRPPSTVVPIDSGAALLACTQDAAWSPTGTDVALLGYHTACPNMVSSQPYVSGQVNIYSAKTGKLVTSFSLDPLILRTYHATLGQPIPTVNGELFASYIHYQSVLWSPTGKQLAFSFVVLQHDFDFPLPNAPPSNPAPSQRAHAGVLVTNLTGTTSQVLVAPYTLPGVGQAPSMEWDLQTGALLSPALRLPPSLSYAWGENGGLLPLQPLNTQAAPAATPPTPIGNPAGGTTFTIWQPGLATQGYYLPPAPSATTAVPATYVAGLNLWYSNFGVWSPDGRYLMTPAYYGGRLALARQLSPSAHDLAAAGQGQAPIFAPHDQVLQTYAEASIYVPVAWRPDGKVIATVSFHSTNGGNTITVLVTLHNSVSGTVLSSFTVQTAGGAAGVVLRWSPDGSHLLFLDRNLDGLGTIWLIR